MFLPRPILMVDREMGRELNVAVIIVAVLTFYDVIGHRNIRAIAKQEPHDTSLLYLTMADDSRCQCLWLILICMLLNLINMTRATIVKDLWILRHGESLS